MIQSPPRPSPRPRPWYPAFDRLAEESGGFRPEDLLIPPDPVPPHLTHLMDVPFLGPCRNWVCTTFRCLCDVPPDAGATRWPNWPACTRPARTATADAGTGSGRGGPARTSK